MFKISHKLNYFSHVNIFSRLRNKQKMSVVDKPLVSYMLSKKNEPDSDELIKKNRRTDYRNYILYIRIFRYLVFNICFI